ncbi:mCG1050991 [Mus musculus]|nr:mCG1050991 [Mus musculus]
MEILHTQHSKVLKLRAAEFPGLPRRFLSLSPSLSLSPLFFSLLLFFLPLFPFFYLFPLSSFFSLSSSLCFPPLPLPPVIHTHTHTHTHTHIHTHQFADHKVINPHRIRINVIWMSKVKPHFTDFFFMISHGHWSRTRCGKEEPCKSEGTSGATAPRNQGESESHSEGW